MRAHANNFDALRLAGALLVLVNHSFLLTGERALGLLAQSMSTFGVMLFFSISGYLIAVSWMRDPHAGRFLLRRARRIMPALALLVLATVLVLGPIFTPLPLAGYLTHAQTFRYLGNLVFHTFYALPLVFAENPVPHAVNGSLWTLPVEVALYAMTPFFVLAAHRSRLLMVALFALAVGLSMYWHLVRPPFFVIAGTEFWTAALLAPFFVGGALIATLRLERFLHWAVGIGLLVALELGIGALGIWREAALCVVLPYAAIAIGLRATPVLSAVGRHGDYSYGLYLWAFPLQQALVACGVTGGWMNVACALPLTAAFAVLSYHLVEKRAMRWGTGLPATPRAATPPASVRRGGGEVRP